MSQNANARKIKFFSMLGVFGLFGGGRWVNVYVVHQGEWRQALIQSIIFALIVSTMAYFLVDLVLARGRLENKISALKSTIAYLFVASAGNMAMISVWGYQYLGFASPSFPVYIHEILFCALIITIFFMTVLIVGDTRKNWEMECSFFGTSPLQQDFLQPQRTKTMLETIFRLFPNPIPCGLYKIGQPDPNSPVLVTGNYELTVRRVVKVLDGMDCWLLVCNSRGINIWCSSLAGHFSTDDIITTCRLTGIADLVNHKKMILPQLCAGNVSVENIKKATGFTAVFGPASIKNIFNFFKDAKEPSQRLVTFDLVERLEMGLGSPIILSVFLIFVYNFFDLSQLAVIIPVLYLLSLFHAAIFPYRFIRNIVTWSISCGILVFAFLYGIFSLALDIIYLGNCIAISLGMIYLINEFTGWSPLQKYSFIPYKQPDIMVNQESCIGCHRCIDVCPKGVFSFDKNKKKSLVTKPTACECCTSCYKQCPVGAIDHSNAKNA